LTHKSAPQVEELADRLLYLSPDAQVVVHHDVAAGAAPWQGRPPEGIHLVERSRVLWGGWSMVEATLRLLRFAVDELGADWVVLLSGEHRPTVELAEWELALSDSDVDALLGAERLPVRLRFGRSSAETDQYLARIQHRWWLVRRPRAERAHRLVGGLMKLSRFVQPLVSMEYAHRREAWAIGVRRSRRPVRHSHLYRGSQWVALSRRAAQAALDVEPEVTDWFRRGFIPDESYLQTVLRAVPGLRVADTPTTFVLETPQMPVTGWMQLSLADVPAVWASGLPFARKVDATTRPEVVTAIDDWVDRRRADRCAEPLPPAT
jgi:hypothetical protein